MEILKSTTLQIALGTDEDIPFFVATERLPGYEHLVGRWTEAQHRSALSDARYAYFIGRDKSEPIGFVIVRDWAAPERVTHIKRIAVCRPGRGHGRTLLSALVDIIFKDTDAHRIWLGLFPDNVRARRAYDAVGFQPEGISRGSAFFGGEYRDELIMALLRPDWLARPPHPHASA